LLSSFGQLALDAAVEGAKVVSSQQDGFSVATKASKRDLVTEVDHAAEQAIVTFLRERRPTDEIVAEESGEHSGSSTVRWYIDPLDGTMNYVHHRPEFAVAVAAEVDGQTRAGAVVRPAYDDWLAADTTGTAGRNATPAVSNVRHLDESLIAVGVALFGDSRMVSFRLLERLLPKVRDFRRIGSASCELFGVATGMLDAYVGVATAPWDLAPGWALVSAAGGRCIRLTTATGRDAYVLGAPAITDELAGLVREYA
jgi:myo-inositol-1(or 4)-monophosphatase